MFDDDVFSPVLGRRDILRTASALALLGMLGKRAGLLASASELDVSDLADDSALQGMCTLTPSATQGPFYLPLDLVRQDITEGQPGLSTRLVLHVVRASDCSAVSNAIVDVWQTNAPGHYSGFAQKGTSGQTWLRGIQTTDANGTAMFDTIFPGWYPGRVQHIHLKVRPTPNQVLTTQMYFKQRLINRVSSLPLYAPHGQNPTTNQTDNFFLPETVMNVLGVIGGQLVLELTIGVA
jgi:protocatechuate 3,4-dioxygenase beta subunit